MRVLQINNCVIVSSSHWKCARETGVIVEVDGSKVNKYLVHFDREVVGTLGNQELWLGDQDLTPLAHPKPHTARPPALRVVHGKRKAHLGERMSAL
jgi:hypothetical protein